MSGEQERKKRFSRVRFAPGVEPPSVRPQQGETPAEREARLAMRATVNYARALVSGHPRIAIQRIVDPDNFTFAPPGAPPGVELQGEQAVRALVSIRKGFQAFVPREQVILGNMDAQPNQDNPQQVRVTAPMEGSGKIVQGPRSGEVFTFKAEIDITTRRSLGGKRLPLILERRDRLIDETPAGFYERLGVPPPDRRR